MDRPYKSLEDGLYSGFIDGTRKALPEYVPELLINERKAGKKVLTTLHRELKQCEEFWFSVAFVTTSGVATIIEVLKEIAERKIKGKVLVSQYLNFTQPEALRRLIKFNDLDVRIINDGAFHAKGYIFRTKSEYSLIIGSSNLTDSALCHNKEWNLKVSAMEESTLVASTLEVFREEFKNAIPVTEEFIDAYSVLYKEQRAAYKRIINQNPLISLKVEPNKMQREALENLKVLREEGHKRALLVSATGTGKTYLSAFDVLATKFNKVLFIVHRENIAKAAKKSFQNILGPSKKMGMFSGSEKVTDADFLFSTIQTLSKDDNLKIFRPDYFDYIIIDETHRAGASTYQKVADYFKPKFLLGMTATPERLDGFDIFKHFNHNIAYEIRLQKALEEDMLSTFHYYGITDVSVNGKIIEENSAFNLLVSKERIKRIIEKAKFYGCDTEITKGLVFCSQVKEAEVLSQAFNERGYRTILN